MGETALKETLRETLRADNGRIVTKNQLKRWQKMKNLLQKLTLSAGKIEKHHIQVLMALVVLSLLVLGAGAPAMDGGVGGH